MKRKWILATTAVFFVSMISFAQTGIIVQKKYFSDITYPAGGTGDKEKALTVFSTDKIIWCGFNFKKAKFMGPYLPNKKITEIKTHYVPKWNEWALQPKVIKQIKEACNTKKIVTDFDYINKANESIDEKTLYVEPDDAYEISTDEIKGLLKEYALDAKEGTGLTVISGSFIEKTKISKFYYVFFDIATKEPLLVVKIKNESTGFGLRAIWFNSIKDTLKKIKDADFDNWKNELKK